MLGGRRLLVQALEGPVVALVEPPVAPDRQPEAVHLLQGQVGRPDRPGLDRCVENVHVQSGLGGHEATGRPGLVLAPPGEVHVDPAGEQVLLVPGALAVAEQDQGAHGRRA